MMPSTQNHTAYTWKIRNFHSGLFKPQLSTTMLCYLKNLFASLLFLLSMRIFFSFFPVLILSSVYTNVFIVTLSNSLASR